MAICRIRCNQADCDRAKSKTRPKLDRAPAWLRARRLGLRGLPFRAMMRAESKHRRNEASYVQHSYRPVALTALPVYRVVARAPRAIAFSVLKPAGDRRLGRRRHAVLPGGATRCRSAASRQLRVQRFGDALPRGRHIRSPADVSASMARQEPARRSAPARSSSCCAGEGAELWLSGRQVGTANADLSGLSVSVR